MDLIYVTDDMAKMLQIKPSTFRKYCYLLEKNGYKFRKNLHGHRSFTEEDILVFKKLIEVKNNPDTTLESACKEVIAWKEGKPTAKKENGTVGQNNGYEELLAEFQSFKAQQEQFNRELVHQIQKQQDYIAASLEKRDSELVKVLKDSMETRKMISAAADLPGASKKWWQFWK